MNIDLKNNKKHKYIFYAVCIAVTGFALSSSLGDIFGDSTPPPPSNNGGNTAVNVTQNQKNAAAKQNQAPQGPVNSLTADASAAIILGEDGSNPFVEVGDLVVDMENPQAPVMTARSSYSAPGSLPAIPRPNLPSIPTPNPGGFSVPNSVPVTPAAPPEVQGILSSDDGSAMAIMSDGTILAEGDTYNDGRIAWIGGEGIHFEDGSSIIYR